jgi:hypothetical protein
MTKVRYMLLFTLFYSLFCSLSFFPSNAYAAAEWEVAVRVEAGGGHNDLVLGADATATDGYDPVWEVYAMLGGYLEAYFPHPEWDPVHNVFSRDIRAKAPGKTTEWTFVADSSEDESGKPYLYNYNYTIKWDLSHIPDNYVIFLTDATTAQQMDMRVDTSYSFLYTDSRTFKVSVYVPPDVVLPDPPQGLTAKSLRSRVNLSWKRNRGHDLAGYNVYRSTTSGSGYQKVNNSLIRWSMSRYTDRDVTSGETYYYVVTLVNKAGVQSGYSNEIVVTINERTGHTR